MKVTSEIDREHDMFMPLFENSSKPKPTQPKTHPKGQSDRQLLFQPKEAKMSRNSKLLEIYEFVSSHERLYSKTTRQDKRVRKPEPAFVMADLRANMYHSLAVKSSRNFGQRTLQSSKVTTGIRSNKRSTYRSVYESSFFNSSSFHQLKPATTAKKIPKTTKPKSKIKARPIKEVIDVQVKNEY